LANLKYLEEIKNKWEVIEHLKLHNSMEKQKLIVDQSFKRKAHKEIVEKNIEEKEKSLSKIMPTETVPKSSIELNKGFTIVGKPKEKKLIQGFNHNFYTIKSDFDEINENQKEDLT
jgi:hypothetical protein